MHRALPELRSLRRSRTAERLGRDRRSRSCKPGSGRRPAAACRHSSLPTTPRRPAARLPRARRPTGSGDYLLIMRAAGGPEVFTGIVGVWTQDVAVPARSAGGVVDRTGGHPASSDGSIAGGAPVWHPTAARAIAGPRHATARGPRNSAALFRVRPRAPSCSPRPPRVGGWCCTRGCAFPRTADDASEAGAWAHPPASTRLSLALLIGCAGAPPPPRPPLPELRVLHHQLRHASRLGQTARMIPGHPDQPPTFNDGRGSAHSIRLARRIAGAHDAEGLTDGLRRPILCARNHGTARRTTAAGGCSHGLATMQTTWRLPAAGAPGVGDSGPSPRTISSSTCHGGPRPQKPTSTLPGSRSPRSGPDQSVTARRPTRHYRYLLTAASHPADAVLRRLAA